MSNESTALTRLSNDRLTVELQPQEKELRATLIDRTHGRTWGPVSLLALELHDRTIRREERVENYRVESLQASADRAGIGVSVPDCGLNLTLNLQLVSDELRVSLRAADVTESIADRRRLFVVDVLPGMLTVRGAGGRLLLPVNGGMLCKPFDKPAAKDQGLIYLEQPRWEMSTLVPVVAAWDENEPGMMVLASKSAAEAQFRVATDGQGAGHVGFGFAFRQQWIDPVEQEEREFRFKPIPPRVDAVHFVAKLLRRHIIEDLGKQTLDQRAAESPEVAYQLRAMTIKLFHGMQNQGLCIYNNQGLPASHFWNTMNFSETEDILRKLRGMGVEHLYTQSVGWNARGHDGLYPTRFPVEERLGGESAFRDLLRVGREIGYHCTVHDNFQMNIPEAPDWSTEHVIHDYYGHPLVRGWWAGGTEYATWPAALPEEKVAGHLQRVKDLGVQGMYYCDYWMAPLEVNYHPQHRGTRSAHQRGMIAVLEKAREIFGAVATEFGTIPGAVTCDTIATHLPYGFTNAIRNQRDWPISKLVDEPVPVIALALHGLTMHQASHGPSWRNAMDAIAWGAVARDEFALRWLPMGGVNSLDEKRMAGLKAMYDLCTVRFGHLIAQEMTSCDMHEAGIVRSSFADGTRVEADKNTGELRVNGQAIAKPEALA